MSSISDTVDLIREELRKWSNFSLVIKFIIGEGKDAVEFSTGEGAFDYFMSLRYQKTGTGQANTFTVDIAFVPEPTGTSLLEVNLTDFILNLDTANCTLQYGYLFPDGVEILSPTYQGQILDYSIQIQNGMILYTITGYSGVATLKEERSGFSSIEECNKMCEEADLPNGDPIGICMGLIKKANKSGELNLNIIDETGDCHPSPFSEDVLSALVESEDNTIFEWIRDILSSARAPGQEDMLSTTQTADSESNDDEGGSNSGDENSESETEELITFHFIVDDALDENGQTTIKFIADNPNEEKEDAVEVVFDWMSGELDDLVLNFQPEFSGAVARSLANDIKKESKSENNSSNNDEKETEYHTLYLQSNGEIIPNVETIYTKKLKPVSGNSTKRDQLAAVAMVACFERNIYKASMSTLGIPAEYDISKTSFMITPLIYGQPHNTAGVYMVTGMTDSLSSQGFTSEWELMKVGSSKEFKKKLYSKYNVTPDGGTGNSGNEGGMEDAVDLQTLLDD